MKNENEKLKQLKMALSEHRPLKLDLGNNQIFKLNYDENLKEYRGTELETKMSIGIFTIEFLLDAIENNKNDIILDIL